MLRPLLLAALLCLGVSPPAYLYAREAVHPVTAGEITPIVTSAIPDQEKSLASGSFTIDLSEVFRDTEDNTLSFSAVSNKTGIATTSIEGSILTVNMRALGECRIRATARDSRNGKADDTFTLVIRSNQPPRLISESALQNYVLFSGGDPLTLDLSDIFQDPDGDNLIFNAGTDQNAIASVSVEDGMLTITPNNIGETRITLSANDLNGGFLQESFNIEVIRSYPAMVSTEIELPFGDHRDQGNYRLIALAGAQSVLLSNIIDGEPNRDWMAYAPDTTSNGLLPFDVSPAFVLRPGKGLWLLSKEAWIVSERIVPTVTLNAQGRYDIPLRPGWNIISNPFDLDLPWEAVMEINEISQGIWKWEHGYQQVDTLYSAAHIPEAYYFNNVEEKETLSLPYAFRDAAAGVPTSGFSKTTDPKIAGPQKAGAATAQVKLTAFTPGSQATASVAISWSSESVEGFDPLDQLAPPAHFSTLNLSLRPTHPDFESQPLAVESRPLHNPVYQYDLLLTAGSEATVSFNLQGLDPQFAERAILVNRLDTKSYDLLAAPTQQVILDAPAVPFTLLIGATSDIDKTLSGLTPSVFTLKQNYPNPFNPSTTIEYTIPTAQYVDLSVFDLMGRHIITLQQGDTGAGLHRVQWTGHDKYMNRVANGVYFYRLETGSWTASRKLTLIR